MKNNILIVSFFMVILSSCSSKIMPAFFLNKNDAKPINSELKEVMILVRDIEDGRDFNTPSVFNGGSKKTYMNGESTCVNAQKKYRDLIRLLSLYGSKYFHASTPFRITTDESKNYDYILKWKLGTYQLTQKFSKKAERANVTKASLGVAFGLIGGAIAEATVDNVFYSPGKAEIIFDYIDLYDNKNNLIHKFQNTSRVLEDDMIADAYCDCAYFNADMQYKFFIKSLSSELTAAIKKELE